MEKEFWWNSSIFRNATRCNKFLKVSLYFYKMATSFRNFLLKYSEKTIFYVKQYVDFQKRSMWDALKVLESLWKLFSMKFVLQFICSVFLYPQVPHGNPSFTQVRYLSPSKDKTTFKTSLSSTCCMAFLCIFSFILSHN